MFTSEHRDAVRRQLLGLAEKDPRITGAAVTGSAADGRGDRRQGPRRRLPRVSAAVLSRGRPRVHPGQPVRPGWPALPCRLRQGGPALPAPLPDPGQLIGLAWHHVLHARSSIERGKPWQAKYWISGVRDQTLALACLRLGAPVDYARGADALPVAVTGELEEALVRSLDLEELRRALRVAATRLLLELAATDAVQAQRLKGAIRELADLAAR